MWWNGSSENFFKRRLNFFFWQLNDVLLLEKVFVVFNWSIFEYLFLSVGIGILYWLEILLRIIFVVVVDV